MMDKSPPRGRGRPSTYDHDVAVAICERLAKGEGLLGICRDPRMPDRHTVVDWALKDADFAAMYAHARDLGADANAERAVEEAMTADNPVAGRLRFDALRWHASKIAPKRYGDKLQHANAAGDGDQVTKIEYAWAAPKEPK